MKSTYEPLNDFSDHRLLDLVGLHLTSKIVSLSAESIEPSPLSSTTFGH